jgi:hypothetical protein
MSGALLCATFLGFKILNSQIRRHHTGTDHQCNQYSVDPFREGQGYPLCASLVSLCFVTFNDGRSLLRLKNRHQLSPHLP